MDDGSEVCYSHGPIVKDAESNNRFNLISEKNISLRIESLQRESPLVETEAGNTSNTKKERHKGMPRGPGIHNTPCNVFSEKSAQED